MIRRRCDRRSPQPNQWASSWMLAVVVICLLITLIGCGGAVPEILFADAQLFLVEDLETGTVGEQLRLYVAVNDGDGIEDISVLSVVHDESELYWQASAEEWVIVDQEGDSWIGLPDLRPVVGDVFPRGRYRLIIEDGSLQEAEGSFGITAPPLDSETVEFPLFIAEGSDLVVVADGPVVFRVYTRAGKLAVSREISAGVLGENLLREIPEESGLEVYLSSPPGDGVRLMSGPFALER
jgi:hypothetical protein